MKQEKSIYLDTSAYLSVLLQSKESALIQTQIEKKTLCSSVFMFLEAQRNIIRLSREKKLASEEYHKCMLRIKEDVELFELRNLTLDLCLDRNFPMVSTPRSADLIHLKTALWFYTEGKLKFFLSLDKKQCRSATEMGLPVAVV